MFFALIWFLLNVLFSLLALFSFYAKTQDKQSKLYFIAADFQTPGILQSQACCVQFVAAGSLGFSFCAHLTSVHVVQIWILTGLQKI